MSFSNLSYVYRNLPAYFRRDDEETLLLQRFLGFYGETLDAWDTTFDSFFEQIAPETASEEFIDWWLWALFDWSWFPQWYTLADKRLLYAHMGKHLARRGTRRGIELWLLDFSIVARVHVSIVAWGDSFWGENNWSVTEPLHIVVEILFLRDRVNYDSFFWGDGFWGEALTTDVLPTLTDAEIEALLRFQQPVSQEIVVAWQSQQEFDVFAEYADNGTSGYPLFF